MDLDHTKTTRLSDVAGLQLFDFSEWSARHDNDNWRLFPEWSTPAEFMQRIRRHKENLRRELAADFRLRNCPEHRLTWEIAEAMERCCLLHYYGVRD